METNHKREKFKLLAEKRREQVEHNLRLIGNLSRHMYEWDPKEVHAIFGSVRRALNEAEAQFHRSKRWPTKH